MHASCSDNPSRTYLQSKTSNISHKKANLMKRL
ncbi:hypothetical protein KSS87_015884 [Heliosperma pusillum]|nr:hypothetical protein KSS87_015884 [Heliosperma pusillum]